MQGSTTHMCMYAKLLQLCPTLCKRDADCSPPGSSVHGDSPGKNTEVPLPPASHPIPLL